MHYVKEKGAEGVEILPDQMLKNAPDISQETVDEWHQLLTETGPEAGMRGRIFKYQPL